jgi:hypothetical protein
VPFLLAARVAFAWDVPLLPWLASAYFFLAGLRLVHDAFHDNLTRPRAAGYALLLALSGLMLGSCTRSGSRTSNVTAIASARTTSRVKRPAGALGARSAPAWRSR